MRSVVVVFSAVLSLLWSVDSLAGDSLAKIRKTQTLVIGVRESPPFAFSTSNNGAMGYSIDLCLKVADGFDDTF